MSKNSQVVDGEASESDSEVEVGKSPDLDSSSNKKEFVIVGEAPESDDESKLSPTPAPLEPDLPLHSVAAPTPSHNIYNSLLHQKLCLHLSTYQVSSQSVQPFSNYKWWEANISLRATLEGLVKHTTDISVEKLSSADKTLLNVQECMRATNANLTLARARIKQLRDTFEKANCLSALPTVKTST